MNAALTTIVHADGIAESFGDDDAQPTAPAGIAGVLPDAISAPEPLPSVAGLTGAEMGDRLTELHRTMTGAVGAWSQAGGGYAT
ncbi:MAG: hypothetical protein M3Q10_13830, partial [Chloroflexota bacterium]|nr:hypothetical protein [Chloroflexota bacterium]